MFFHIVQYCYATWHSLYSCLLLACAFVQAAKLTKTRSSENEPVELVECDLEKEDAIEKSLGNAGVIVCSIGASEKEISDISGPYRIDYKATENLIKAGKQCLFTRRLELNACFSIV